MPIHWKCEYIFEGTKESGPGECFRRTSLRLGKPRLFKYLFFGQPKVSVSGMKNIKQVLGSEFKNVQTSSLSAFNDLLGKESLIMSTKSEEHSFQRRLVGASMTPEAIDKAIPSLQKLSYRFGNACCGRYADTQGLHRWFQYSAHSCE
jgi:cytochrome P450